MSAQETENQLPFFPKYETEQKGWVSIWWFDNDFSQSRYNFFSKNEGSNACTIIACLVAAYCHYNNVQVIDKSDDTITEGIIYALAESILEGNDVHRQLRNDGALVDLNLTVPEAIQGCGKRLHHIIEWKTELHTTYIGATLFNNFKNTLLEWYETDLYRMSPDLYVILIADSRSVLFLVEEANDTISVVDSHAHLTHGALIASAPRYRLKSLCSWFNSMILHCFSSKPDCYELTYLYFKHQQNFRAKLSSALCR